MDRADYFTRQQLNRRPGRSVTETVHAAGGIYAMSPTCYLQLVARMHDFVRSDLDSELYQHRSLLRVRALRGSLFLVPRPLLDVVVAASKRQVTRGFRGMLLKSIGPATYETWSARIEALLAEGDLPAAEIRTRLDPTEPEVATSMKYIIALMAAEGRLIRANVTGTWRSDRFTYARWEDWVGEPVTNLDEAEAQAEVARWYLQGFGPATIDDFRWWAGLTKAKARSAFAALGLGDGLVDLGKQSAPGPIDGVRLLPVWDTALIGHVDRSRIVPETMGPYVYDPSGNATSVVLVNGRVSGVWQLDGNDALTALVAPLERWSRAVWDDVAAEAERIRAALGASSIAVQRTDLLSPLPDRPRNAFMSPLTAP